MKIKWKFKVGQVVKDADGKYYQVVSRKNVYVIASTPDKKDKPGYEYTLRRCDDEVIPDVDEYLISGLTKRERGE